MEDFSIYCDESCHLENDHQRVMALGAVWCPTSKRRQIYTRIREIKRRHGIGRAEMKWTRLSPSKLNAYLDIIDYFFDDDDLHFQVAVLLDKKRIKEYSYKQTHDEWYYEMYFELLKNVITEGAKYKAFLDIKDAIGGEKVLKLRSALATETYDYDYGVVDTIQLIRSDEVEIMQLVDILLGAVMAKNRGDVKSLAKRAVIERIKERSGFSLIKRTLPRERKFNILIMGQD